MPKIVFIKTNSNLSARVKDKDISYEYPDRLDLKPGSDLHDSLKTEIIQRANESHSAVWSRKEKWKAIERTLTSYIPLDDTEQATKDDDDRKPIRVVIPVSFATLETLMTYWVAAFLRDPIFKFEGYGPEDSVGAMLLEKTIQQQAVQSAMGLSLHTWWRDGLTAGFGAATPMWTRTPETKILRNRIDQRGFFSRAKSAFIKPEPIYEEVEVPAWEGNILYNIDYRNFLPDPTVPVYETHKGEAAGWIERLSYINLLEREEYSDGKIFNVKYLQGENAESVLFDSESSTGRSDTTGRVSSDGTYKTRIVDTIYKYIKLVPFDWCLSDSKKPEVWLFALSGDKVITQAHKVENNHGEIPIVVNAPDYDGHSLMPISRMEIIHGLQTSMDWLFDSHMANVRKAVNDMLIVDPSLVNMYDLSKPGPGKIIRLRPSSWGRGVRDAVMQLPVNDVTKQHIPDAGFILDIISRTSAASDGVQGIIRKGSERRSAAEFQGTMSSALSRIEKTARITWMQGMLPLQRMLAENTQQFMSSEQYVRINAEWQDLITKTLGKGSTFESAPGVYKAAVDRDKLNYAYDIIPHDGSMPGAGDPQTWLQIFQIASQSELIAGKVDLFKIFKHLAVISGAKNIESFEVQGNRAIQPVVRPDEEVERGVQAGDLLPVGLGG